MDASGALATVAPARPWPEARAARARLLMFGSGFAGLGYQIVWTGQCAQWLGHETVALLAVIAAFFGGLAVGARGLARRIEASPHPGRWYAAAEGLIALWALLLAVGLGPFGAALLALIGPEPSVVWHWSVAFAGTFLVLLPATAAMGATLPAMERALAEPDRPGGRVAGLYAANTAGAVLGVLATAYLLVPQLGLTTTALCAAAANALCALMAIGWLDGTRRSAAEEAAGTSRAPWSALLFATGLLGIGYEVLVVRVLSQVAENTVFTYANLLAVYLVGTALGAAAYARWSGQGTPGGDPVRTRARLLQALAMACLASLALLSLTAPRHAEWIGGLQSGLGGVGAALGVEAVLAACAFLLPTLVMGALFSHLTRESRTDGLALGRALAANTLGAAVAPVLVGVLLLQALGTRGGLLLMAAGYLLLVPARVWRSWAQAGFASALAAGVLFLPEPGLVDVPPGGRLVSLDEGVAASVSVVEDARGVMTLHINNRQQEGSSLTRYADGRQALLPMLLHGEARTLLFLGLGTGVTAAVAAEDPGRSVTAVELLSGVIDAAEGFREATGTEAGGAHLRVVQADARRFLRAGRAHYDLIVADNFHPARSGSGLLYTVEHFRAARERLAPGGLMCQWLPLHQLDLASLRSVVASFQKAFPGAVAVLATLSVETPVIGLVGHAGDAPVDPARVRAALAAGGPTDPRAYGFDDAFSVLGMIVADAPALSRFASAAPLNTDDRPVVVYRAPRATYAPEATPAQRLDALLGALDASPSGVLSTPPEGGAEALVGYWRARDRFLAIGQQVRPTPDVRRMLAQVESPLLGVLDLSPRFRPAYDPLLRMAEALAGIDPDAARHLLAGLSERAPDRPEAAALLRRLGGSP
ncbi:MAG: fused MFS/spermidine synthase [Rhodocyclaceae bacterium]|nr:fused MFS/spermidine synthase [Rhodocyclaceae bacterium]